MTDVVWLDGRRPHPPEDLRARLRSEASSGESVDVVADLLRAANDALELAIGQPGRVRAAAFDLLAADALITYACEAALEGDDPDAELDRLVSAGGAT